jgi:hypothetical protein
MHYILLLLLLMLAILGPQWWVQAIMAHYHKTDESFPGTGGELARHLLDKLALQEVKVEVAEGVGDHYDPVSRSVRLTRDKMEGRTLTAVVTASHEVGHAIQHAAGYRPFIWRIRLVRSAQVAEKIGSFLLFAVPVLTLITKAPAVGIITLVAAVSTLGLGLVVQLLTLPVEWDASFGRALPLLEAGYINQDQQRAARWILRACALTYVAGSLAGLLNFWRWMRLLRR